MGRESERIRSTLSRREAIREATMFLDKLMLKFLLTFKENHQQETEEVADKFEELDKIWRKRCKIRQYKPEAYEIFAKEVKRNMALINQQPHTNDAQATESQPNEGKPVTPQPSL